MSHSQHLKIFFSGIGGSGMSAIASFMHDKGHTVVGSDRSFDRNPSHPVYRLLSAKGITVVPQDGRGIDGSFDFAVFSTAVETDQPEVIRAGELRIPVKTRPEYLAEIVGQFQTIAVAGTSGKSTTTGMLAFLMHRLGLEPNFIGGGRVKQFKSPSNPGNSITGSSDILVMEACESDGTIVRYRPRHSVLLNLDLDHHSVGETAEMFLRFGENTSGRIVANADDSNLRKVPLKDAVTFSIEGPARYRPDAVSYRPFSTDFSLRGTGFRLFLPGAHNLYNALACIALLSCLDVQLADIARVLHEFNGIERRFDVHLNDGKRVVVDDYAHNPHKIRSLMQTMAGVDGAVCYVFQPHGYAPTRMMRKEYLQTFTEKLRAGDHLILLPIFYEGGTVTKDISSDDLAAEIRSAGKSAEAAASRETVLSRMRRWPVCVIFGARDETLADFAAAVARSL